MKTVVSAANSNLATSITSNAVSAAPMLPAVSILPKTEGINDSSSSLQFTAPTIVTVSSASPVTTTGGNISKRPASLDLNKATVAKKQRLVAPSPLNLDSPDLQNINKTLNTPDLEKILLSSNMLQTPQPGLVFPTKVGPVTVEQEAFGKGFEEALHSLHNSKNSQAQLNNSSTVSAAAVTAAPNTTTTATATGMSGGSFTYTTLEPNFPVAIKDEPQNAPVSPPVSPIDMETQEKIKLERKRQRNRVAASKCRKRKLERISKLEDRVKTLKGENADLGLVVKTLKDHLAQLKQQVMNHIESGCNISAIYNSTTMMQSK